MIRPYNESDREKLLELCKEFWVGTCLEYGDFDYEHTATKLDLYLDNGICLVADDVSGFILLCETTALCSNTPIAAEVAWYVTPSARGRSGIDLLNAAFKYCEVKGIKLLSMMYMESSMPASIERIYKKAGMTLRETTYVKRF